MLVAKWSDTLSRTRTRFTNDAFHGPWDWSQVDTSGNRSATLETSFQDTTEKVIVDSLTPGYFKLVKRGEFLPINDATISEIKTSFISRHQGFASYKTYPTPGVVGYQGEFFYPIGSLHLEPPTADASKIDIVVIQALASAKQPDFDALTFIGEFGDTVRLFKSTFSRFIGVSRRIAKNARRYADRRAAKKRLAELRRRGINVTPSQRKGIKSSTRATSSDVVDTFNRFWLEARYGWRPLVYDVQSLMKLLRDKADNMLASKSAQLTMDISNSDQTVVDNGAIRYQRDVIRSGRITYHAKVYYKDQMSQISANPVITAYELTRFSFVIDWFIDIGSWLQAMSPREGFTKLGISTSVVFDYNDAFIQSCSEGYNHSHNVSLTDAKANTTVRKYVRSAYDDVPLPSINVNLNPAKVLDLIAIILNGRKTVFNELRL